MQRKARSILIWVLSALIGLQGFVVPVSAQETMPTPDELDQLLAPVALYPDALLSQITTASTNPQEILDVNAWLEQNRGLTGDALTDAAQNQGFDPAFLALVNFPQVLEMMAQNIDDYAAIGRAFSTDQEAVAASIQRLRAQAYEAGSLRSNPQQTVELQQAAGQPVYVIQPATPNVVYVPQYDPSVVFVRPGPSVAMASLIGFGVGVGIGALVVNQPWGWGGWGWNWGARRVYYNHGYWGGWARPYRPPRPWYRPRPVVWANRPGYRGNWGYRPPHYRPPSHPVPRPSSPGNRTGNFRPTPTRPNTPNRSARPSTGHPVANHPPTQPGRPSGQAGRAPAPSNRPNTSNRQSAQPNRSSGGPNNPGTPNRQTNSQPRPNHPVSPGGSNPSRQQGPSGKPSGPSTQNQRRTNPSQPNRPDNGGRNQNLDRNPQPRKTPPHQSSDSES